MTDEDFDQALITSAFAMAATVGWTSVSPAAAAREAGLPLEHARQRFASRMAILLRFGELADAQALSDALDTGPVRERLFDVIMRRFDSLQRHRAGVLALLTALPTEPGTALALAAATTASMGWMLEAASVSSTGVRGALASQGLTGVWLYALRAWRTDDSPDLSGTMAALDRALAQAERVAGWTQGAPPITAPVEDGPKPFPEPDSEVAAALAGVVSGAGDVPPASSI